jgi:hypothetical protein
VASSGTLRFFMATKVVLSAKEARTPSELLGVAATVANRECAVVDSGQQQDRPCAYESVFVSSRLAKRACVLRNAAVNVRRHMFAAAGAALDAASRGHPRPRGGCR